MALERLSACDDVNEQEFAGLLLAIPRCMHKTSARGPVPALMLSTQSLAASSQ
jgi:hypothetical protein